MGLTSFTYKTKQILFSHYKMEKLLKQIANNTEANRSFSVVVSDDKTRFKTWFKSPIVVFAYSKRINQFFITKHINRN